jgi:hypothetical protein
MMPACGTLSVAAKYFKTAKQNVSRSWIRAKENFLNPEVQAYRASPMKKGRKEGEVQEKVEP